MKYQLTRHQIRVDLEYNFDKTYKVCVTWVKVNKDFKILHISKAPLNQVNIPGPYYKHLSRDEMSCLHFDGVSH